MDWCTIEIRDKERKNNRLRARDWRKNKIWKNIKNYNNNKTWKTNEKIGGNNDEKDKLKTQDGIR